MKAWNENKQDARYENVSKSGSVDSVGTAANI